MPTAAKIVAAVITALTMFLAAEAAKVGLPEGTQAGYFSPAAAAIGFLNGWMVLGALAGRGYGLSVGTGLRSAVMAVFWTLLAFSILEMIQLSIKKRYDGPIDAILGVFQIMVDYARLVILPDVLVTLGVGGTLAGLFAEWARRRWN